MIRTVLGDVEEAGGNVLMHEHIQCVSNDMLTAFGREWLDEKRLENYAVGILQRLKTEIGLGVFVDGTAIDLGRNVPLLKRISARSGVHIVASTGFYYYPSMLSCKRSAQELASWLLRECEQGMDGADSKPGILKCAVDGALTADMQKRIEAVSIVQAKTALPMYVHCSHNGNIAYEAIEILERHNVNPEKTILGHASRRLDVDYLESILRQGYYVCIDQAGIGTEERVAQVVYELCERGYARKLLFSHDRPLYDDFAAPENSGLDFPENAHIDRYSFSSNKLLPAFEKRGCLKKQYDLFLKENAWTVLNV